MLHFLTVTALDNISDENQNDILQGLFPTINHSITHIFAPVAAQVAGTQFVIAYVQIYIHSAAVLVGFLLIALITFQAELDIDNGISNIVLQPVVVAAEV